MRSWVVYSLLLIILAAGLTLRVWNINFDKGIGSHPDERSTACFYAPTIQLPDSWAQFWEPAQSPLNPLWNVERQERRSFTYGHFPLYLGVGVAHLFPQLAPLAARLHAPAAAVTLLAQGNVTCEGFAVAGRLVIALLDTFTIYLLFLLGSRLGLTWSQHRGRRIYSSALGLLAASFYAFTAQAIQLSHFFAMDPASTSFTVLAVLGAVQMVQDRTLGAALVAGLGMGLAVASKFSALPILILPLVALLLILRTGTQREKPSVEAENETPPVPAVEQLRVIYGAFVALFVAVCVFFVSSPYALLDFENFIRATLVEQGRMVRGIADMPFTRQYRNTTPYLYFIEQQVAWGMWWPLGLIALSGTGVMLVKLFVSLWRFLLGPVLAGKLDDRQNAQILIWAWLIPYFGLTGAFLAKFNRYMSPVLPFMVLFGAALIWELARAGRLWGGDRGEGPWASRSLDRISKGAAIVLAFIGVGGGLFWSTAYVNGVYNSEHPWISASRWVYENVPSGSVILWELWDDPIPKSLPEEPGMDMGSTGLRHIDWSPYEEDTLEKYDILKARLREADYVAYSSKRIYDSVDELPQRYPMTIKYYEGMWDGSLGFELAYDISTPPALFGFTFEDRHADESWSLYDHPQVTIFRKVRDLSDEEFDAYFQRAWESATPYYRGEDSPISGFLNILGLGSTQESEHTGIVNRVISLLQGAVESPQSPSPVDERPSLMFEEPLENLPVVDNFRWNVMASESTPLAILCWWLLIVLLGWLAWPLAFAVFQPLRDRGYFFAKAFGWLLSGWFLWVIASLELAMNSVSNAWLTVLLLGILGVGFGIKQWSQIRRFWMRNWALLGVAELLFAGAFLFFVWIRMRNPDIWQPWFGGEKFMEFAFLNGILRSPYFPPVDPHFAGGFINYYYFGIYLIAYLIKLTGIYAEVAFNLAIPMLFAMTVSHAFGVAYSAIRRPLKAPALAHHARSRSLAVLEQDLAEDVDVAVAANGVEEEAVATPASAHTVDGAEREQLGTDYEPHDVLLADDACQSGDSSTPAISEPLGAPVERGSENDKRSPNGKRVQSLAAPDRHLRPNEAHEFPWHKGLAAALLAPLFVTLIGNLDGLGQVIRNLANLSDSGFRSAIPGLEYTVRAYSGLGRVLAGQAQLAAYNFWDPSRVLPATINEFPYWSFLFADLHPHLIGIPLSVLFLGMLLALMQEYSTDWTRAWPRGLLLLFVFGLLLGTLASVNLWELPTYAGLGILGFVVCQYRNQGRVRWGLTLACAVVYVGLAYLLFLPFFTNYKNVGASGIGLVREPDSLGLWLLIWGLLGFVIVSWILYALQQRARSSRSLRSTVATGLERMLYMSLRYFDRLPRLLYLHKRVVKVPTLAYLVGISLWPLALVVGALLFWRGYSVLALCLIFLAPAFLLLWRRGLAADPGNLFVALLSTTGLAILAGTQVIYLKDFLNGGDWYRMNTLFKFFSQVWVIWGVAAAIALPRLWSGFVLGHSPVRRDELAAPTDDETAVAGVSAPPAVRILWGTLFSALLVASLAYIVWGTPARLEQRFLGWRPPFGTLNGMDFMRQGVYTWPDASNEIEMHYDWKAIQWLLHNVRGNAVIAESDVVGYYREGGSRVASLTGLSGLRGMHASEQRYPEDAGYRDGLHREFWSTPDPDRTLEIIRELNISLIYVGQLERYHHPEGVTKLELMAEAGQLVPIYENERVIIYRVAERKRAGRQLRLTAANPAGSLPFGARHL